MSVFRVPRDPPPFGLSFKSIVLDDSACATGSFDAYVDTNRDYATWFVESSIGLIIGDVPVNGGKVLGGIIHAQVASRVEWRLRAKALQAKVTEFETTAASREVHMQEETARALARERELWQKERKAYISPSPHMLGRGPIIPPSEIEYMPATPGLPSGWGSFTQALWTPQDPGYTLGTLGKAGPSTGSLTGDGDDDDDDNDDVDQYFRDDDSQ